MNESTTFNANSESESTETRIAFRKLRANSLKVWRDCAETLRDERGVDVLRVECMIWRDEMHSIVNERAHVYKMRRQTTRLKLISRKRLKRLF